MRTALLRHAMGLALIASVAGFVNSSVPALAHAPIDLGSGHLSPDTAQPLGDPESPGLIYGTLQPGGSQYVSFSISAGQPFQAMVLLPLSGDAFTPGLAIVGPGLGDPSEATFTVPDGDGVYFIPQPDAERPIFLADLGLRFLAGPGYNGPLQESGDYYLVIYSADGNGGSYTVGTGYGE